MQVTKECRFEWQLPPNFRALLESNAQYKDLYHEWEMKQKADMDMWQKENLHLHEQCANGVSVHSHTWEVLNKKLEALNIQKSRKTLGEERLRYTIKISTEKVFSYFPEIQEEFKSKRMDLDRYRQFLKNYREVIDTGNGLPYYESPEAEEIKKVIKKFLPE